MKTREITVGLVGNPNCGKTTIFNALTGARQKVANWSGVTVEKREGRLKHGGVSIRVIDLPGIYSLTSYSMEEIITRDFIIDDRPDVIVNVVDAGNLERNLYLTTQLINIGARSVMALNMFDEAANKGLLIDSDRLGTLLGMPVVKTVGTRSVGIPDLLDKIVQVAQGTDDITRHIHIPFGDDVEAEIRTIQERMWEDESIRRRYSTRWLSVRLLERDTDAVKKLKEFPGHETIMEQVTKSRALLERQFDDDIETIISDRRYGFIAGAVRESVKKTAPRRVDLSDKIDRVITNRYLGFPILFLFLWALFHLTFALGEYPMNLIEAGVHHIGLAVERLMPAGPLKDLIVDGVIGGVGGVIVFLPNILILFMGISFMEDTGYMARAAFIMDRVMHTMGLHGKSFIPLIMGFGCNVPAIMATRSLENRQDRILTILINPFMSCSARLPVYILFAGAFFHAHAGTVILSLYLIGILLAFVSARLYGMVFFRGGSAPFVMELPPYRIPTFKSTLLHMWDRASQYLRKMGGIILAFSVVIWFMGEYPKSPDVAREYDARIISLQSHNERTIDRARADGASPAAIEALRTNLDAKLESLEVEKITREKRNTMIGRMGAMLTPLTEPLGFNQQMGISLVTGFVAKEVVVSTMGVLYHAGNGSGGAQQPIDQAIRRPEYGITPLAAYTFMLFVLLYVPCLATVVVMGREAGWRWAFISLGYQLALAWSVCFIFYNAGRMLGF
jgi:ferrous iron transport protein B